MKRTTVGLVMLLAGAAPLSAQHPEIASRVAAQLGSKFVDADCNIKEGHFLVSSAKTKLSSYASVSDPVIGARLLKEGVGILNDAILTKDQKKNPAAWYWLGRTELLRGELQGADTALTRAAALAPQCAQDIQHYRTRGWAAMVLAAQGATEAKQTDSAAYFFHQAILMDQQTPHAFNGLAGIMLDNKQMDSAIVYFGKAAATTPTDPSYVKVRNRAAYNYAVLLLNAARGTEAVAAFHRYLGFEPTDDQGQKGLAQAFRAAGMVDSAAAIERQLLASSGSEGGDPGSALSDRELQELAARQYNDKDYAEAAKTYGLVLQRNPNHRDALFAQANSYLATSNGEGLAASAGKLVELDPLGEYNYKLMAQGYKFLGKQDKVAEAIIAEYALPVDLQYGDFSASATDATFTAKAVGREARDENNALLPPHAVTITFEALAKDGSVVGSSEATIPALKVGEESAVSIKVSGGPAAAWRYRMK